MSAWVTRGPCQASGNKRIIRPIARCFGGQLRDWKTRDPAPFNVRLKGCIAGIRGNLRWCITRGDQERIRRFERQLIATSNYLLGDICIWLCLRDNPCCRQDRVQCCAEINAQIPGHLGNRRHAAWYIAVIGHGHQPFQPRLACKNIRIRFACDRRPQRRQQLCLGITGNRVQRIGAFVRVRIGQLELHKAVAIIARTPLLGLSCLRSVEAAVPHISTVLIEVLQRIIAVRVLGRGKKQTHPPYAATFPWPARPPARSASAAARLPPMHQSRDQWCGASFSSINARWFCNAS